MQPDDVLFSVGGVDVSLTFLVAVLSAVGAALAAEFTRRSALTSEKSRRESDEPLFRGRWIRVRRRVGELDPHTLEQDSVVDSPVFRLENIGRVTARGVECSVPGLLIPGRDLDPGWQLDVPVLELGDARTFTLTWTGGGGSAGKQKLRPGKQPTAPPIWDGARGDFERA